MTRRSTQPGPDPRHVSLVALPDAVVSTLFGIYDVMNAFALMDIPKAGPGARAPFHIDIVGETAGPLELANGVPVDVGRAIDTVEATDVVIVPSVLLRAAGWKKGRYPRLAEWLRRMHERGAVICSACSGIFLLAETWLFDVRDATVHFAYDQSDLRPDDKVLALPHGWTPFVNYRRLVGYSNHSYQTVTAGLRFTF